MKDFLLLCKAVAGSMTGIRINSRKKRKKKSSYSFFSSQLFGQVISGILISVVFGFNFAISSYSIFDQAPTMLESYYSSTIISEIIALFGLSILLVLSTFFLSKNDQILLPYPIEPGKLFLARFVICLRYLLVFSFLYLSQTIVYLVLIEASVASYFVAVLIFVTIPLLLVSVAFIVVNLLAKIINFKRHRSVGVWLSVIISFASFAALYLPMLVVDGENGGNIISQVSNLSSAYSSLNWMVYVQNKALFLVGKYDWIYIFIQLFITAAIVGLSYLFAKNSYIKNIGVDESKHTKKDTLDESEKKMAKAFKKASYGEFWSNVYRHFKTVTHDPQLVMVCIVSPLLLAVIIGASFGFAAGFDSSESFIDSSALSYMIITGVIIVSNLIAYSSAIAVSMEGKNIAVIKSSPFNPETYIDSKIFIGFALGCIIGVFEAVVLGIVFQIGVYNILLTILATVPIIIAINYVNIWADLLKVKFDWSNVAELTNNSWKAALTILMSFIIVAVGIAAQIWVFAVPTSLMFMVAITSAFVFSGIAVLFRHFANKRFKKLMKSDITY